MSPKIAKNIFAHYSGLALGGFAYLLVTPILIRYLGYEAYGVLALCISIVTLVQFLDFGISQASLKFIAEWSVLGEKQKLQQLLNTGLFLLFLVSAGLALILGLLSERVVALFSISSDMTHDARDALIWNALSLLWIVPALLMRSFLEGLQRYDLSNLAQTSSYLLSASGSAILAWTHHGIVEISIFTNVCYLLQFMILFLFVRWQLPHVSLSIRSIQSDILKQIWGLSTWNFVRNVSARISWDLDTLVIGFFLKTGAVSEYVLGRRLPYAYSSIGWRWVEVFLPVASQLKAEGKEEALRQLYIRASRICIGFSLPIALWLILLAPVTLKLWLGTVSSSLIQVQCWVTFSILLDLSHSVSITLLSGTGALKRVSQYFFLESVLNLFLSLLLVVPYGIVGVAMGTTISSFVIVVFFQVPYACRSFRVSLTEFGKRVLVPQMLPSTACAFLWLLFSRILTLDKFLPWLAVTLSGGFVYILLFWRFGLHPEEKSILHSIWNKAQMQISTR